MLPRRRSELGDPTSGLRAAVFATILQQQVSAGEFWATLTLTLTLTLTPTLTLTLRCPPESSGPPAPCARADSITGDEP